MTATELQTATPSIVTRTDELPPLLAAIRQAPFVAMDTEFMRESTYWPQLCLLQFATPEGIWIVDPLGSIALDTLWTTLVALEQPLVLHAAEQDLELIHLACGQLPANLFDTQIAATVLGMGEQVGYANLVGQILGVQLDKSQSRTDWNKRPLTRKQLEYAADDVRYLSQAYPLIQADLIARKRLEWLKEDLRQLSNPRRFDHQDDAIWQRVRGQQRVNGIGLAVLQALGAWREQRARAENRPRRWILPDDLLVDLARHPPASAAELTDRRGWPARSTAQMTSEVWQRIRAALELPRSDWPKRPAFRRATPAEESVLAVLQTATRLIAQQQDIAPSLLATTDDLLRFLRNPDQPGRLNQGWRQHILGEPLQSLLAGETCLGVAQGSAVLEQRDSD